MIDLTDRMARAIHQHFHLQDRPWMTFEYVIAGASAVLVLCVAGMVFL
jgi:hypothetical protein